MRVFLNGGGCGPCAAEVYRRFGGEIDKSKPLVYVPLAMEKEQYPGCLEWITGEMEELRVDIRMVQSGEELAGLALGDYGGVFIGGGNTYKLLHELKASGGLAWLGEYLERGGPVFGGSAGAILLGADIAACKYADENLVGLQDTKGLDVLGGLSLLCHYGNEGEEITARHTAYLKELSRQGQTILALPEEDTIVVKGDAREVVGTQPYFLFKRGGRVECVPGQMRLDGDE